MPKDISDRFSKYVLLPSFQTEGELKDGLVELSQPILHPDEHPGLHITNNPVEIVIHCSASKFGDGATFNQWHIARGFNQIGYHFVILNQYPVNRVVEYKELNGRIQLGRPLYAQGAHVKGHNKNSIGICMVGLPTEGLTAELPLSGGESVFSPQQVYAMHALVGWLSSIFSIKKENIHGHNFYASKLCPGFKVEEYTFLHESPILKSFFAV